MTHRGASGGPLVSVVTPCYNAEAWVVETIESVLAQSYPHVEMIVVDDGSSDGSWERLQAYASRITTVRQENGGAATARNRGAAMARGEFLLFLDADDLIARDTVEALVAAARRQPGWIAACPWSRLMPRDGGWVKEPPEVPFPPRVSDPLAGWLEGEWVAGCSLLWPRALFEELGGYATELSSDEDGDLMYRALAGGVGLVVAEGGESLYRSHGTSTVSVSSDLFAEHRYRSRMRVLDRLDAQLRAVGRWEQYRVPLGVAYQRLALLGFALHPKLARECLRKGEAYAGRAAVSRTLAGRVLVRLLGLERKERLASALAKRGVMTRERQKVAEHQRLLEQRAEVDPPTPGAG